MQRLDKNMNAAPLVSVVMSVYNGEKYLDEAIASILHQTYINFEFIIIDDGLNDESLNIIKKYQQSDSRIKLISRENKGLIDSLNEGIRHSCGEYIARMDADDISLVQRFEEQVKLMQANNLDVCGSHYYSIDESSNYTNASIMSLNYDLNKIILSKTVPFAHGSVMIKKDFLLKNKLKYGLTQYNKAEDYALWVQCVENGANISNVNEFLFKRRDLPSTLSKQKICSSHSSKISSQYINKNYKNLFEIVQNNQNKTLTNLEQEAISYFCLKTIFKGNFVFKIKKLQQIDKQILIYNIVRVIFGK